MDLLIRVLASIWIRVLPHRTRFWIIVCWIWIQIPQVLWNYDTKSFNDCYNKYIKKSMRLCILRAHFSRVLSDTQIPNSDSSLGVKVLTGHVNVICIFIFILILAVVFSLLSIKNFRAEMLGLSNIPTSTWTNAYSLVQFSRGQLILKPLRLKRSLSLPKQERLIIPKDLSVLTFSIKVVWKTRKTPSPWELTRSTLAYSSTMRWCSSGS